MNKQGFINLLQKPDNISALDLKMLEDLAATFPYCQAAHILIAKGNYICDSMYTEQKIKKAALYTVNRRSLKQFIQSKNELIRKNNPQSKINFSSETKEENISESHFSAPISQSVDSNKPVATELDILQPAIDNSKQDKIKSLIERFIQEDPSISRVQSGKEITENPQDLASKGIVKFKTPISETFANLLVKQGRIDKAIEVYDNLILKYPEKKIYFAGRIEELKKQL